MSSAEDSSIVRLVESPSTQSEPNNITHSSLRHRLKSCESCHNDTEPDICGYYLILRRLSSSVPQSEDADVSNETTDVELAVELPNAVDSQPTTEPDNGTDVSATEAGDVPVMSDSEATADEDNSSTTLIQGALLHVVTYFFLEQFGVMAVR